MQSASIRARPLDSQKPVDSFSAVAGAVNRITFSTTSNTSAHYIFNSEVFQFTADQSWQTYEREVDSRKKQGQKGSAGIPIKGIPIELTGDVNYERALSEREYKERFNSLKQQFTARHGQQSSSTSSLASAFASEIRDANSIEAWKKCVTAIDVPNIYAYASRDESGEPFLNVIWSPANLAGLFPSIKIEFVLPAGATISNPSTHVAMGSGRTFRIIFPDHKRGFQVGVNGALHRANGDPVQDFTATALVPKVFEAPPHFTLLITRRGHTVNQITDIRGMKVCGDPRLRSVFEGWQTVLIATAFADRGQALSRGVCDAIVLFGTRDELLQQGTMVTSTVGGLGKFQANFLEGK
jgi:hypothetical protein